VRVLVAAIACWGIGCAATTASAPVTEYTASDAILFNESVDLVWDPIIVEGEWGGAFERRIARADLIAAVRAESIVTEVVKRRTAYRITVEVAQRLKGESSDELVLRVRDDEPGYRTVEDSEDQILHEGFIAFVKWEAREGADALVPHWHLSPDSPAVRAKIEHGLRRPGPDPNTQVEVVAP
jgi:hypothetical protein